MSRDRYALVNDDPRGFMTSGRLAATAEYAVADIGEAVPVVLAWFEAL